MSCSFCYEYGHNRAGCPKRKKRVAEARANGEANWLTREQDRKDLAKERRKQSGSIRRCSWCGDTGHNRRGCPSMKEAKAKYVAHNAAYRQHLYNSMKDQGFGVGALVEVNPEFYDYEARNYVRQSITYLVTGVRWGQMNWHCNYSSRRNDVFQLEAVSVGGKHPKSTIHIPHPGKEGIIVTPDSTYTYGEGGEEVIRLVSPVSASVFETTAPGSDWFTGELGLKFIFDKELSRWEPERWFDNIEELSGYEFLEKV